MFASEDKQDPISVKSRTGLLLNFGIVPIFWSSNIQSKIFLSTLEAKYIDLFQGMRELAFAQNVVTKLVKNMSYDLQHVSQVSKVWEDNTGPENLANSKGPRVPSKIKHISIKYHWSLSMIKTNEIEIICIDSKHQRVDIFTKELNRFFLNKGVNM